MNTVNLKKAIDIENSELQRRLLKVTRLLK